MNEIEAGKMMRRMGKRLPLRGECPQRKFKKEWVIRTCKKCGSLFKTRWRFSKICPNCDTTKSFMFEVQRCKENNIKPPKIMLRGG